MENKNFERKILHHMITGFLLGVLYWAILESIDLLFAWTTLLIPLGIFLIFITIWYFFCLFQEGEKEKLRLSEWQEAIKLAQSIDPRIQNKMAPILKREAMRIFKQKDQEFLDSYTHGKLVEKKADFIVDVFNDLLPLYEEKEESQK
jgi:hypothetical protein